MVKNILFIFMVIYAGLFLPQGGFALETEVLSKATGRRSLQSFDIEDLIQETYPKPKWIFDRFHKSSMKRAQEIYGLLTDTVSTEYALVCFKSTDGILENPHIVLKGKAISRKSKASPWDLYYYSDLQDKPHYMEVNHQSYEVRRALHWDPSDPETFGKFLERDDFGTDLKSFITARYPDLSFDLLVEGRGREDSEDSYYRGVIGILRNKEGLTTERLFLASEYKQDKNVWFYSEFVCVAQTDSIRYCGGSMYSYRGENNEVCFVDIYNPKNRFDLKHPERTWISVKFDLRNNLVFAESKSSQTGFHEYWKKTKNWFFRSPRWRCFAESPHHELQMVRGRSIGREKEFYYLCQHHPDDDTGTLRLFHKGKLYPTNVSHFPLSIVTIDDKNLNFLVDEGNPRKVLVVVQQRAGLRRFDFPRNPVLNQKRVAEMVQQAVSQGLLPELPFSFVSQGVRFDAKGLINQFGIRLASRESFLGTLRLESEGAVGVNWEDKKGKIPTLPSIEYPHPPMKLIRFEYGGGPLFYLFCQNPDLSSSETIVVVPGGPEGFYEHEFSRMISEWWKKGHAVLVTQEQLRTGYGWRYAQTRLGNKIGEDNLDQILEIIEHGLKEGVIPNPEKVHLWGHSYGGGIGASFALRQSELMAARGARKFAKFATIIAEAPVLSYNQEDARSTEFARVATEDEEQRRWFQSISPLSYASKPLEVDFLMVVRREDSRCPLHIANTFFEELLKRDQKKRFSYIRCKGTHFQVLGEEEEMSGEKVGLNLLNAWIERRPGVTFEGCHQNNMEIVYGHQFILEEKGQEISN